MIAVLKKKKEVSRRSLHKSSKKSPFHDFFRETSQIEQSGSADASPPKRHDTLHKELVFILKVTQNYFFFLMQFPFCVSALQCLKLWSCRERALWLLWLIYDDAFLYCSLFPLSLSATNPLSHAAHSPPPSLSGGSSGPDHRCRQKEGRIYK